MLLLMLALTFACVYLGAYLVLLRVFGFKVGPLPDASLRQSSTHTAE